jgi:hypothetical protein
LAGQTPAASDMMQRRLDMMHTMMQTMMDHQDMMVGSWRIDMTPKK